MASKGHLYEATDGFRWHLKAANGRIIAESGEAYTTGKKAQDAYDKVFNGLYALHDESGEEVLAAGPQGQTPGLDASRITTGVFAGLPDDPNHPLYSPLTVDGNK